MAAGELRERVTIQAITRTPTAAGDYTYSAADVETVWAKVTPLGGTEQVDVERPQAVQRYVVRIRYRTGLVATDTAPMSHRLSWRGVLMNIASIINKDERSAYLEIDAEAGVAQ